MMEIVLLAGSAWTVAAGLFYWIITKDKEQAAYQIQYHTLYENSEEHHVIVTGRPLPKRLTIEQRKERAFTNALVRAAQERRQRKRK